MVFFGDNKPLSDLLLALVVGLVFGTLLGVLVIPGLYYVFGLLASKGRKLIQDDVETPLSETIEDGVQAPVH